MTGALKELARLAPLEDDDKKLVQIVSRESQRLNQIITEFLDYSREKSYSITDLEIVPLIEETLLLIERHAGASGKVTIDRNFPSKKLRALVDRDAIKQVFWNLCNNALRAMPDGGTLTVSLDTGPETVRISIRDTGTGFDPRSAARIFEPFQSGFRGGNGLGLAIVYQILQAHRGQIRVDTVPGLGTEFVVELPAGTARARSGSRNTPRSISDVPRPGAPLVGKV
jgi:two-component system sensor histidine kinase PilS (NtrC family)